MPQSSDPAAQLLQRQVTVNAPQGATSFTGSIAGNVLTVTAVASGVLQGGMQVAGAGIPGGVFIVAGATGLAGAQIPGTIAVVGGGSPTGSGQPASVPSAPSTGVTTGISGTLTGDSNSSGNQALTGNGGTGTYLLNEVVGTVASESMTSAVAQINTGPAVTTNSNPASGNLVTALGAATGTAPINPGAVGYVDKALPYSPGTTYVANVQPAVVQGVNNPQINRPAADVAQVDLGDSVINVAMRQGSMSDTGMAT